jgi:membrane-associated phospholipid phosphatase
VTIRQLLVVAAVAAALTLIAIFTIDAPVARALADVDPEAAFLRALDRVLALLDQITGMDLPRGRLATVLIVVGALLWRWQRPLGRAALIIGVTHAVSRVFGGYLKPMFGRLRPREALASGHLDDSFWWPDGVSFPSGHVAHYAALAFAAAVLWPRARVPAFVVLGIVIAARVGRDAHFVSDVTGSIAIAALAAAGFATMLPAKS